MATLTLAFGTMSTGKSTMALQLAWQLRQSRGGVALWTLGDRSGGDLITTRIGLSSEATAVAPGADLTALSRDLIKNGIRVLIIDEAQFATREQVDALAILVDEYDIDVHCFALNADFLLNTFEGTARLFSLADVVRELPVASYCWCGRVGRCNARVIDGVVQRSGDQQLLADLTGPIHYQVLCRRHYRTGELRKVDIL